MEHVERINGQIHRFERLTFRPQAQRSPSMLHATDSTARTTMYALLIGQKLYKLDGVVTGYRKWLTNKKPQRRLETICVWHAKAQLLF